MSCCLARSREVEVIMVLVTSIIKRMLGMMPRGRAPEAIVRESINIASCAQTRSAYNVDGLMAASSGVFVCMPRSFFLRQQHRRSLASPLLPSQHHKHVIPRGQLSTSKLLATCFPECPPHDHRRKHHSLGFVCIATPD